MLVSPLLLASLAGGKRQLKLNAQKEVGSWKIWSSYKGSSAERDEEGRSAYGGVVGEGGEG